MISIYQVDAFTGRMFRGNPAAVCLLHGPADEKWMQNVAAEMNLSETAFVYPLASGLSLRWFTPTIEVDLCGHATLAASHVLWKSGILREDEEAVYHTRSGVLTAGLIGDWIEMDFPATPCEFIDVPHGLSDVLGAEILRAADCGWAVIAEVDSEETVRGLKPDLVRLMHEGLPGAAIVTARAATEAFDFVSRCFAPALGICEDPVTGAAHCCLGPYWQEILEKYRFTAYQASARGGVVKVQVNGDRVMLGGQAVTVLQGIIQDE